MRHCAICHRPMIPCSGIVRLKKPRVSICFECCGVRRTEDGDLYYDPEYDKRPQRWRDDD